MYLQANTRVRRVLRPFLNLPNPPILQPFGPAICAGLHPLPSRPMDGQNLPSPALWRAMSVRFWRWLC